MNKYDFLEVEHQSSVAIVKLNRPKALNALSQALIKELGQALDEIQGDASLKGVVISSTTEKAFSAGADTKEIDTLSVEQFQVSNRSGADLFQRIEEFPLPVAAAIRGYALGGGFELALACDIRFAADNARFGLPEVTIGFLPGWGGVRRLSAIIGIGRAKYLVFSGKMMTATDAFAEGLLAEEISGDPEQDAVAFISSLPDKGKQSIGYVKHLFAQMVDEQDAANLETLFMASLLAKRG
ncbi:enoyl-CoA hydratase/isomerase family protein [Halomonas dongshanensis]|uniref:Enoyl-CoA hydratase/isomerase family protein n=1 Tax=Halomonas dongshanensis TaxID=2890835 RepID=A0ABT2EAW6_9GAMM|nr:enoyl-CoA hydratase/isomerase family protein [Halomonas dongshanensis]MCS2608729.1 enoyl-CoA hydratase/isomerase family protein [Halomonas dongshanensis]